MNDCTCDVCTLLRWLDEQHEGRFDRAASALVQALWRVIGEAEAQNQTGFHQELVKLGLDPHTFSLMRTGVKLASWELDTPEDEEGEPDDEAQPILH